MKRGSARGILGTVAAVTLPSVAAFVVGLMVLAVVLSACAPGTGGGGSPTDSGPPVTPDGRFDMGVPGEAIEQVADLTYYPACGNEPLTYDGTTWYPYEPTNSVDLPTSDPAPAALGGAADASVTLASAVLTAVLPGVVAPEPGQDEGVLTIYEGGLAHWESAMGDLDTWLTDTEIEYMWAC